MLRLQRIQQRRQRSPRQNLEFRRPEQSLLRLVLLGPELRRLQDHPLLLPRDQWHPVRLLDKRALRQVTAQRLQVDIGKPARRLRVKDIHRALALRRVRHKAGPRKDFVRQLQGRLGLEALRDKVVPAVLGREAERLHVFRSGQGAAVAVRDKTQ